jgi:hypothetical protein
VPASYQNDASDNQFPNLYLGFVFDQWETFWSSQKKLPTVMDFNKLFKKFQIGFEMHLMKREPIFLTERTKRKKQIKND